MSEEAKQYVLSIPVGDTLISHLSVIAASQNYTPERAAEILLTETLENTDLARVHLELTSVRRELRNLRADLAVATTVILVAAGKRSQKDAEQWVKENLMERF